ncbi:hypothetical protein [Leptospira alexanderi]|uniref:hypothetical protein n=1 Tax=Leptospira alexanderi TaxID=100053 RepID=UPI0020149137|nr:hypothetical protein [Leptospira alexanderi]
MNVLRKTPVELSLKDEKRRISIAKTLGKLNKLLAKWLDESELPAVLWNDKKALTA